MLNPLIVIPSLCRGLKPARNNRNRRPYRHPSTMLGQALKYAMTHCRRTNPFFCTAHRLSTLSAIRVIDDGADFGSEFLLHALDDRVGHGATASASTVRRTRHSRRLSRELWPATDHLEFHRPSGGLRQGHVNDPLRTLAESQIAHHLRH